MSDENSKELADARTQIRALEHKLADVQRSAARELSEARAIQEETTRAMEQAAEQLAMAQAVGAGLFGLHRMCRSALSLKVSAARMLFRQSQDLKVMEAALSAVSEAMIGSPGSDKIKAQHDKLEQEINKIKSGGEKIRMEAYEIALTYGIANFEQIFDDLVTKGNT